METLTDQAIMLEVCSDIASALLSPSYDSLIDSVEIFGSVARGEAKPGSDIDLIVVPHYGHIAETWAVLVDNQGDGVSYSSAASRNEVFRRLFAVDFDEHPFSYHWYAARNMLGMPDAPLGDHVDVFVFPPDWRTKLDELQRSLDHTDPMFMQNIAQDALRYDRSLGTFR